MKKQRTYHFKVNDVVLTLMDDDIIITILGDPTDITDQLPEPEPDPSLGKLCTYHKYEVHNSGDSPPLRD